MSEQGAALQTYNLELVKCLEDLKVRRNDLLAIIDREESEKSTITQSIKTLQDKLNHLNRSLNHHKSILSTYEKTIEDTENGFKKILESSQALLNLAQMGANKLEQFGDKKAVSSNHFT